MEFNMINLGRIKAAGEDAKRIYRILIGQIVMGIIYGFLYKNPQWFLDNTSDTINSQVIEQLTQYYRNLNIALVIFQAVSFSMVLLSLNKMADNLINASFPISTAKIKAADNNT
jgi:hypothetical protein